MSSSSRIAGLLIAVATLLAADYALAAPLLRILYNAETRGALYPCPSWGGATYGGLARRAGAIGELRKEAGIPTLFIVGPGEFAPDNGEDGAGRLAGLTRKGYDLLKVDDGYLSPKAAQWFTTHAGGIPAGFRSVEGAPQTRIHTVNALRVAVVFFPPLPQGVDDPTPEMVRDALSAGRKVRSGADLVIGVSAWGSLNERDMLPRCEGVFDILFGAGTGSAFDGSVDGVAPGVLWARPERDGKGVNVVEVLALPQPGQPNDWVQGITIATRYIMLSDTVACDPAMEAVIGSVPPVTAE